jgi:hypothetical protein
MTTDLHDVERHLRDATTSFADELEISHDAWARLRGRLDAEPATRRRRVAVRTGFAVAALAAAAIVAVLAVSGGSDGGLRVETPPATSPTPTAPPRPGAVYATQDVIVVLDAHGDEIARYATAGEGTIATLQAHGTGIDASVTYVQRVEGSRCGPIAHAGPGPGDLGAGRDLHVSAYRYSPDETRLATATGCESQLEFLVVRPVDGGLQQVWAHEPGLDDDLPLHVDSIAWSPDGTRLAVGLCDESCSIALIDPTTSGRLVDAPTLAVGRFPTWLDDHRVAFVRGPESDAGPERPDAHEVRWVDADTADTGVLLADLGATDVGGLDADPVSGLLLLRFADGTLAEWDGTELRDVAAGASAAAFVQLGD